MGNPTGRGGFQKGQSGNPGGRPKAVEDVQALARKASAEAIAALIAIAKNGKSESARVSAASVLLDRGYGRPAQTIDATVRRADPDRLSDAELAAYIIRDGSQDHSEAPDDPSKLN